MKVALVLTFLLATVLAVPQHGLKFRRLSTNAVTGTGPKSPIGGRIINGEIAEPHSIPFQVFLTLYTLVSGGYCGGSLISTNYILTAAHCTYEVIDLEIILGAQSPLKAEDSQLILTSAEIISHPDFDMYNFLYDIALLKLDDSVTLNEFIDIVPLPNLADVSNTYEGATAKISGWGFTDDGDGKPVSDELRWVENSVISNEECNDIYGIVQDNHVCVSAEGRHTSCTGDSGGPVTINGTQIGIVSYGESSCSAEFPSGNTRITSFLDWIGNNTDLVIN